MPRYEPSLFVTPLMAGTRIIAATQQPATMRFVLRFHSIDIAPQLLLNCCVSTVRWCGSKVLELSHCFDALATFCDRRESTWQQVNRWIIAELIFLHSYVSDRSREAQPVVKHSNTEIKGRANSSDPDCSVGLC